MRAYERKYQYDKLGNVEQVKQLGSNGFTRNFSYFSGKNTLEKIEDATPATIQAFTYDDAGNQITAGSNRNYVWNPANQLISYYNQAGGSDPTIFAQYDYNSGGERVSKLVRTGSAASPIYERVIYIDGIFEYHILENGTTYEKNYVHVMDASTSSAPSRVAMVRIGDQFPDDISDSITYNLEDQIGSSTVRLNTSGGVIDKEEYYPFGDSSLRTFSKKRYRYVGKEKDIESGLYYYGARYYAAWTCRFISIDPMAADYPFYTPYNYAGNKPINKIDIDGEQEEGGEKAPKSGNSSSSSGGQQQNNTTSNTKIHTVKKGDTLSEIAEDNNTSVKSLRKANNLDPADDRNLQIGTELKVPGSNNTSGGENSVAEYGENEMSSGKVTYGGVEGQEMSINFDLPRQELDHSGIKTIAENAQNNLFGSSETLKRGFKGEVFNFKGLGDKLSYSSYEIKEHFGNEKLLNVNHTTFIDPYKGKGNITETTKYSLNLVFLNLSVTSDIGFETELDLGFAKLAGGLSLNKGISLGASANGHGASVSYRPGVASLTAGAIVAGTIFAPQFTLPLLSIF